MEKAGSSLSKRHWWWRSLAIVLVGAVVVLSMLSSAPLPSGVWTEVVDGEREPNGWARLANDGGTLLTGLAAMASIYFSGRARSASEVRRDQLIHTQAREVERLELTSSMNAHTQALLVQLAYAMKGEPWKELTVKLYCTIESADPPRLQTVAKSGNTERMSSGIVWTKGKGCVGQAWELGKTVTTDLEREDRKEAAKSKTEWASADDEVTQGLSWDEVQKVIGQPYGAVVAMPILRSTVDAKVVGILAIDVPASLHGALRHDRHQVIHLASTQVKFLRAQLDTLWGLLQD